VSSVKEVLIRHVGDWNGGRIEWDIGRREVRCVGGVERRCASIRSALLEVLLYSITMISTTAWEDLMAMEDEKDKRKHVVDCN
jgi:hypothetical protein